MNIEREREIEKVDRVSILYTYDDENTSLYNSDVEKTCTCI